MAGGSPLFFISLSICITKVVTFYINAGIYYDLNMQHPVTISEMITASSKMISASPRLKDLHPYTDHILPCHLPPRVPSPSSYQSLLTAMLAERAKKESSEE